MRSKVPLLRWVSLGVLALLLLPALADTRTRLDASKADLWREHIAVRTPEEVGKMILEGRKVVFVDVREPAEYAEFHLPEALPVPLRDVNADPRTSAEALADADLVIPYCLKDFRGYEGAKKLQAKGLSNVGLMEGYGINAWKRAELPVAGVLPGASDREALEALAQALGIEAIEEPVEDMPSEGAAPEDPIAGESAVGDPTEMEGAP